MLKLIMSTGYGVRENLVQRVGNVRADLPASAETATANPPVTMPAAQCSARLHRRPA